jgi:hypothetical protein
MKTKHQTDITPTEQAAATYEQQQLAPGQHDMDLGVDEDSMDARVQQAEICDEGQLVEEQYNMDLDGPGPEQHELIGEEHNMELEREMVLEQSGEQLPGISSSQRSKTWIFEHMLTCP